MIKSSNYNLRERATVSCEAIPSLPTYTLPECQKCSKKFSRWDTLRSHMRSAHEKSNICCQTCGKQFPTVSKLVRHELTHTEQKEYHCSHCDKSFQRADNLKVHEATHGNKLLKCNDCGDEFKTELAYSRHSRARTNEEYVHGEGAKVCKKCSSLVGASTHLLYEDKGIKYHQCTYCFKSFTPCKRPKFSSYEYEYGFCDHFQEYHSKPNIHRKIGSNCSLCSKLFSSKQQAKRHEKEQCWKNPAVVERKTRFKCQKCPKLFSSEKKAQRHWKEECWSNRDVVRRKSKIYGSVRH